MGKTIPVEKLAEEVMSGLEEYAELAADVLKKEVQEAGKVAKQQISQTAPRKTGRYAKSWAVKKVSETSNSLEVTVHSKNRYMLTHLLENGHAKRGGGRVAAIPVSGSAGAGRYDEEVYAASYLQHGDGSGVHYAYWHPQSEDDPCLLIGSSKLDSEVITCRTELRNMPLLNQAISKVFGITRNPEPAAEGQVWNYSRLFLKGSSSDD